MPSPGWSRPTWPSPIWRPPFPGGPNYSGYPAFNTPDALGYALNDMGFDLLSTTNNHSLDKGYSG